MSFSGPSPASSRRRRHSARRRSSSTRRGSIEACTHLRDSEGFNFLSDITATDYLGWGAKGVAGYLRHGLGA